MKVKRNCGITALKAKYFWICVTPWAIGLVLFFILPIVQSLIYSFCSVKLLSGGVALQFQGLKNFKYIFAENADYTDYIAQAFIKFAYSFPIILILSLILALMLNQDFKGRIFFRALYFLPVIIASGAVLKTILSSTASGLSSMQQDESIAMEMFNVTELVDSIGLPAQMSAYFTKIIDGITGLIWNCGIQTVLFIAGMQAIPSLLYEVSKVEGATKWEEFWFITFPSLSQVTLLVIIYTMVEQFTSSRNPMINAMYTLMKGGNYDETSAVLWFYFALVGIIMGILIWAYNRFLVKRWS